VVGRQRVVGRRRKITTKITENSKLGETWVLKNHQSRNLALTSAKIQKRGHKRKNPKSCSKQYRGNRGKFVLGGLYSRFNSSTVCLVACWKSGWSFSVSSFLKI